MDPRTASIIVTAISVGALVVFIAAMRRPDFRTVTWTSGGLFLLGLAWVSSLGYAVGAVAGQRRIVGYALGYNTRYIGVSQVILAGSGVLTLILCVVTLRLWVHQRSTIGIAGLIAVTLGCFGIFVNALNGVDSSMNHYIALAATVAALLAATILRPGKDSVFGPAVYGISLAIGSAVVAVVSPGQAFQSCRSDKCGPTGLLFTGALGNENALGLSLALSLPFVFLAFRGPARWVLGSYIFVMVYLSGSRTALTAAVVTVAMAVICNPRIQGQVTKGRFGLVAVLTGITAVVLGFVIPFTTTDNRAFSYRGLVWATARRHIGDAPVFGSGSDAWQGLASKGEISAASAYSAHNIWLDAMFAGGAVGLIAVIALVVTMLSTSPPWLLALPLVTVLTAGIFERPWTLTATNIYVWVLPALLLLRRERVVDTATVVARAAHSSPREGPQPHVDVVTMTTRGMLGENRVSRY